MILFEDEYPIEGQFTKPEILNVRAIPVTGLPKRSKTIEPIEAITMGTAFEGIGKAIVNKKNPPPEGEEEKEYVQVVEVGEDGEEVVISENLIEKDVERGEEERRE